MATLRQSIQAKIDAATAEVATLTAELQSAESTYADWLDQEYEAFKAKAESFAAVINKYL